MRVLFNTRFLDSAASVYYYQGFLRNKTFDIECCQYFDLEKYDIVLFMSYKEDLDDLKSLKQKYPTMPFGVIDPRGEETEPYLKYVNFIIIDSIEMEDYWMFANKPIIRYVEYPDVPLINKTHCKKEKIIIGYHGNLVHLNSAQETVLAAIEEISGIYDVELTIMYNISTLGRWNHPIQNKVKINHIQWNFENYEKELSKSDIGIVPNFLPPDNKNIRGRIFPVMFFDRKKENVLNYRNDDYILRFKMSSNPGRIIVFGRLGIPVVSDFYPSAMECIAHGYNGFIVRSRSAWFNALSELINDCSKRQIFSDRMKEKIKRFEFGFQNEKLRHELLNIFEGGENKK